jgi:hypothetical protein
MVTRTFQLLLLLAPICIGTNIEMDMFDITFFRMGIVALFIAMLFDRPRREIPQKIKLTMATLLGLVFGNVFIHAFTPVGLHNSFNLFLAIMGMAIVYVHYDEKQNIKKYVLIAAAINLVFFITQKIGFDPIWTVHPYAGQEGALAGNQPRLITYFALVTPFLSLPFLALSVILAAATKQFVILIPVAIMLFMRLKEKREKILFVVMLAVGLILIRGHVYGSLAFRFNLAWEPALKALFKQPLIGVGLGERVFPELAIVGSSYLQFIFGVGVLGAAWLWYASRETWHKIKNNTESIALVSLAMVACIEYPVETPRLWFLIIGIVTMYLLKTYAEVKA